MKIADFMFYKVILMAVGAFFLGYFIWTIARDPWLFYSRVVSSWFFWAMAIFLAIEAYGHNRKTEKQ